MRFRFRRRSLKERQYPQPWAAVDPANHGAVEMIYSGRGVGASLLSNAAAVQDGATTDWIAQSQGVIVSDDDREVLIDGAALNESALGAAICNDKALTKKLLMSGGVRTPDGQVVKSAAGAVKAAEQFSGASVVKPLDGGFGHGVTVDVQGEDELRTAYRVAAGRNGRRVIVEECVHVETEYRCMATRDECVSVIERVLPSVIGDGKSTVRHLIRSKNNDRARNPAIHNLPIPLDHVVALVLDRQGLDLDSIPRKRQQVLVRNVGGLSGGGEPFERYDEVSPEVKSLACQAIQAIPSLVWGGVDIVTERHTGVPYVIEVNSRAGYGAATFPVGGKARDVAPIAWRQRRAITKPDPPKSSGRLELCRESGSVTALAPRGQGRSERGSVADLFFGWLSAQGWEVDESYAGAVQVRRRDTVVWFGPDTASGSDLLAPHRILRRHNLVRLLLARKGVHQVRGGVAKNSEGMRRLFGDEQLRLVATPKARPWGSHESVVINSYQAHDLFNAGDPWVVQSYRLGQRAIVLANRTRALSVLQSASESAISIDNIQAVCGTAVDAVRAIPELRWAAVDVAVGRTSNGNQGLPREVLVEGMTINRTLTGNEEIRAGDMDDAFRFILED